ncbi:MAG: prohibitin family protein [Dehalococcoidales bacterium]
MSWEVEMADYFEQKRRRNKIIGWTVVIVIVTVILLTRSLFTVGAGEIGVIFDPLSGGVQPAEAQEGLNVKPPWASVAMYNTKTQEYTMSGVIEEGELPRADRINTVTSEGLYVGLDITVLFRIDPTKAYLIRRNIALEGEYQQIVVRPAIRSTIREVVSDHMAADIYGEGRATVEVEIFDKLSSTLEPRYIDVEQILLREVDLPSEITKAIESKKQAEQEALRMQYVLQKEGLEKERKLIDSLGKDRLHPLQIDPSISTTTSPSFSPHSILYRSINSLSLIFSTISVRFFCFSSIIFLISLSC